MHFRLRKQLLEGCCRPGTPRRQVPPPGTAAADKEGRGKWALPSPRHGELVPGRWLRPGATGEPSAEPERPRGPAQTHRPRVASGAFQPRKRQPFSPSPSVRSGTEGRLCPTPTLARAVSRNPSHSRVSRQRAASRPAPRGRARPLCPSLTWLGRFRWRLGHGWSRPKHGRGSGATAIGCPCAGPR